MKAILAATEFSLASWNAVRFAADMALDFGTDLTLVHASHMPVVSDVYFDLRMPMDDWKEEDQLPMDRVVQRLQKKYGSDLRIKARLKIGFSADVIRDLVSKGSIGVVVRSIAHT